MVSACLYTPKDGSATFNRRSLTPAMTQMPMIDRVERVGTNSTRDSGQPSKFDFLCLVTELWPYWGTALNDFVEEINHKAVPCEVGLLAAKIEVLEHS